MIVQSIKLWSDEARRKPKARHGLMLVVKGRAIPLEKPIPELKAKMYHQRYGWYTLTITNFVATEKHKTDEGYLYNFYFPD